MSVSDGLVGGAGVLGGLGLAGAVVGCCGGKLLLLGGLATGAAAGWLRYWPLLALAGVLVAVGLWRRHRRQAACASPAPSLPVSHDTPAGSETQSP